MLSNRRLPKNNCSSIWMNLSNRSRPFMKTIDAADFWQFSLSVYDNEQVQKTLLNWQNDYGLNVNLCLFLAYLDYQHVALQAEQLDSLIASIGDFNEHALQPLRDIRGYLKRNQSSVVNYNNIRTQILDLELAMEKLQQHQLVSACNTLTLRHNTQAFNLALYLPNALLPLKADLDQALHQSPA
ncbi:TIGR02444 family protein [Pseudoalteromonas ruthenica]|nr:TIGR02444 family protein [Pseudoalteromonas ruthenica]